MSKLNTRRPRRLLGALLAVAALVVGLGVTAVVGNTYAIDTTPVTIPTAAGDLSGVLALPQEATEPVGVVVFVHGDGPTDATSEGFYQPIWEQLAAAGYASLSWDKPGVGGSEGSWLDQSLADRATETEAAIDWVREQPGIDPSRIGLWGASQGGWVVPAVAAAREDVTFTILVAPAISWVRQGRFHTAARLDDAGATPAERDAALASFDADLRLLDAGVDHATYLARTTDPEPMDAARWGFVLRNHRADATADLHAMAARHIPTLLLLGDEDRNVDVDETERVYRETLGDDLVVRRFADARHTLARTAVQDSAAWGLVVGVLAPRQVFVPGYLDAYRELLDG